jgi:hypothetical protein
MDADTRLTVLMLIDGRIVELLEKHGLVPFRRRVTGREAERISYDQGDAQMTDQDFIRMQKFLAAIRRHWPGAKIVLRPDPPKADTSEEQAK